MTNEPEIERMDEIIYQNACEVIRVCGTCHYGEKRDGFTNCVSSKIAKALYKAGIGDKKQVVKDFAAKCKKKAGLYGITAEEIDELVKEFTENA